MPVMTSARPVLPSEEWDYLDTDVLRPARSSRVCMTCQHFRYEVGRHCVTLLTCPIHQGLIPQGDHLAKRCSQCVPRREIQEGWCPEAGLVTIVALEAICTFRRVHGRKLMLG